MPGLSAVIIGAGQCGLAMSGALAGRGIDHLVLDRGRPGNSWRTERWEGLRLLSPNRMNGLPGEPYAGADPDGYMTVTEFVGAFDRHRAATGAQMRPHTQVLSVTQGDELYRVQTDRGLLSCRTLVVATGACAVPKVPALAAGLPARIHQATPLDYRRPADLPPGGVLVVGASASGLQLARELALAGRRVLLAVGTHLRLPRTYRGADILTWMDRAGLLDARHDEVDDIERVRRTPSLPLLGSTTGETLDLNALQARGVEIVGRLAGLSGTVAQFSGGLANLCASADLKLDRMLGTIDAWIAETGVHAAAPERFAPTRVPEAPRLSLDLDREGVGTVLWATGYRPDHSWLQLPVFDRKGRIRHQGGIVGDGLYVMGLPYLRSRLSTHIAGATADAEALAADLGQRLAGRVAA